MRSTLLITSIALTAACASEPAEESSHTTADVAASAPEAAAAEESSADAVAVEDTAPEPVLAGAEIAAELADAAGLYALSAERLDGTPSALAEYAGKVTLVVNVASRCGYTGQYAGLQALHTELEDRGFAVLGFPSNEFGGQEPGSAEEIQTFCSTKFGVTFPMFAKCEVRPGPGRSPVYDFLEGESDEAPGWNFCKYLVGKDGRVIAFYPSGVSPESEELRTAIENALG